MKTAGIFARLILFIRSIAFQSGIENINVSNSQIDG